MRSITRKEDNMYDINKNILDQNISEDARDMIAYLNLQYWY